MNFTFLRIENERSLSVAEDMQNKYPDNIIFLLLPLGERQYKVYKIENNNMSDHLLLKFRFNVFQLNEEHRSLIALHMYRAFNAGYTNDKVIPVDIISIKGKDESLMTHSFKKYKERDKETPPDQDEKMQPVRNYI
jgi:hypothetical protein